MVRRLWAFEAEPTVPLHGDDTAVGSHVDDRAARSVKRFSPFDYLTDMEVQHTDSPRLAQGTHNHQCR